MQSNLQRQKIGLRLFGDEQSKKEGNPLETFGTEGMLPVEMVSWNRTVYQNFGQIMHFKCE